MMQRSSLYFTAPRQLEVRREKLPEPAPGQALVRTLISAISSGSERLVYRGEFPPGMQVDTAIAALPGCFQYPLKYGYSTVGEVIDAADAALTGRMVFSFHPHESHFWAFPDELMLLPEGIDPQDAVFLPNMETAVNLALDGAPALGERVTIFGQGVVGLLTGALLAQFPLERLTTLDPLPLRRQTSLALGAHSSLDPGGLADDDPDWLPAQDADLVYELSGNPAALIQAIRCAAFSGRVVIGSWYGEKPVPMDLGGRFHRSRIRLLSSQVSTIAPELTGRWSKERRFDVAWEMLQRVHPARLITHRFPLDRANEAYWMLEENPGQALQVLLVYSE